MRRVVSLYLPRWPTDRLRRQLGDGAPPPEAPLVLKGSDGRRRVVTAIDVAAHAAGVRIGMPVTKAQALVADLIIRDAEPDADAEGLDALARWALRTYTPIAGTDPFDGLVLDITGASHLHGGEDGLLRHMVETLNARGLTAVAAVADSHGAAHAVARHMRRAVTIIPPGEGGQVLAGLPVRALRLPLETVAGLYALGFETIGQLSSQPRAPLVHRFGPELGRRLDQAFGRVAEPIDPVHLPDVSMAERIFAESIGAAETIARYIGKLTAQLCDRLEVRGFGVRQLDLVAWRVDNRIEAVRIGMARPVRDVKRLTRLLCEKIETIDPGFGIERMRLTATEAEPLALRQTGAIEEAAEDIGGLIDVLANRIGAERIYSVAPVASDVPERSVCRVPPLAPPVADVWPFSWPRPVRLFARAEKIRALSRLPDYPPRGFVWRDRSLTIVAADGPERIFGEWWRRDSEIHAVRDYFRVETHDGQRLWIYRTGDGEDLQTGKHEWFLHGVFA